MQKIQKLQNALDKNQREISTLQSFRQTKHVKQFLRQLFGEQSFIQNQIKKLTTDNESRQLQKDALRSVANKNRSEKMKRTWRYLRAIKENYPVEISVKQLRTALKKHRQGLETDIPDVAWRNPSP